MKWKHTIITIGMTLLLSGCSWLNPLIYFEGESGTKDNLPVSLEELIEMAEY